MTRQPILNLSPLDLDAAIAELRGDPVKYTMPVRSSGYSKLISSLIVGDSSPRQRVYPSYHFDRALSLELLSELIDEWESSGDALCWRITSGPPWQVAITKVYHVDDDPIIGPVEDDNEQTAIARVYLLWRMREQNEGVK